MSHLSCRRDIRHPLNDYMKYIRDNDISYNITDDIHDKICDHVSAITFGLWWHIWDEVQQYAKNS